MAARCWSFCAAPRGPAEAWPPSPAAHTGASSLVSLLATIALGFLLGMRHATDADHVVAVATIVATKRSLRPAAAVGAL